MKLVWTAVMVVCLSGAAQGESMRGPWLRRLTLAASCATSFWDFQTTRTAVGFGAQEANSVLANGHGSTRWGRMIGLKVGLCAGMAAGQELMDRKRKTAASDYVWSGVNTALAIRYSAASLHNRRVADQLKQDLPGTR